MAGDTANIALVTNNFAAKPGKDDATRRLVVLVERAKGGDRDAFELLMLRTQQKVVSTAWRMLGNQEDARDAAQEVFLKVYRYLGSFEDDRDFNAWMYRITVNVCNDIARSRKRHQGQHASIDADPSPEATFNLVTPDSAEATVVREQQRAIVTRAMAALPEKERAALILRDLEGLSAEEAAVVLGTKPATVRSQASMARAKIKAYCERFLARRRGENADAV